jgi:hypothetical protein
MYNVIDILLRVCRLYFWRTVLEFCGKSKDSSDKTERQNPHEYSLNADWNLRSHFPISLHFETYKLLLLSEIRQELHDNNLTSLPKGTPNSLKI